jgi:hypothetical protein
MIPDLFPDLTRCSDTLLGPGYCSGYYVCLRFTKLGMVLLVYMMVCGLLSDLIKNRPNNTLSYLTTLQWLLGPETVEIMLA